MKTIPVDGAYRNVPLHAGQSPARLEVVKRDIDAALALHSVEELIEYARGVHHAPEARGAAAAQVLARAAIEVDDRVKRTVSPRDVELAEIFLANVTSLEWRSSTHYCNILDVPAAPGQPGPAERERPLEDD